MKATLEALGEASDPAWDALAAVAARLVGASVGVVLFPADVDLYRVHGHAGVAERKLTSGCVALREVLQRGEGVTVAGGDALARPELPFGQAAMVAAPIVGGGRTAGVVAALDLGRVFGLKDLEVLQSLATVASALLRERLEGLEGRTKLNAVREQLERADRMAMVGRLGAGIAHELGTPLAVVAGRARQLASGQLGGDQVAMTARTIAEQADRMAGIIRQLLDFARRRGPRLGRFDARTLLRQAFALLEPVAARKGVRLEVDELPTPQVARFDGSQMLQVLTNLVMNAVQATPPGGAVRLALSEGVATPPESTGLEPRSWVRLHVIDSGVGIAEENLARVFEPFFTTKDTGEGTGLGLSVAQGIVRDHDGWIAVESQRGQGSTFTVHLPG